MVSWVGLHCVIVVFPDYTYLGFSNTPADGQIGLNMTWLESPNTVFSCDGLIYSPISKIVIVLVHTDMNIHIVTYGKVNMDR